MTAEGEGAKTAFFPQNNVALNSYSSFAAYSPLFLNTAIW